MVLVSVGDEQPPDTALVLDEVCGVGDDQVDAVHVPVREAHAAVHHDDLSAVLIDGHVLADLVEAAKRDDFHFFCQNFALLLMKSVEFCERKAQHKQTGRAFRSPHLSSWACRRASARFAWLFRAVGPPGPAAIFIYITDPPAAACKYPNQGPSARRGERRLPDPRIRRQGSAGGRSLSQCMYARVMNTCSYS